jgi:hypothetical protein
MPVRSRRSAPIGGVAQGGCGLRHWWNGDARRTQGCRRRQAARADEIAGMASTSPCAITPASRPSSPSSVPPACATTRSGAGVTAICRSGGQPTAPHGWSWCRRRRADRGRPGRRVGMCVVDSGKRCPHTGEVQVVWVLNPELTEEQQRALVERPATELQ